MDWRKRDCLLESMPSHNIEFAIVSLPSSLRLHDELCLRRRRDPEEPWAEWNRGKGLTQNSLAALLGGGGGRGRGCRGGFGIHSQNVTPSPGVQGKGYKWSQFGEVWARYLPAEISSPSDQGDE